MPSAFDCDLCEHNWVFGSAGECDQVNLTCICPAGFSGVDDWSVSETCHVHDRAAYAIHVAMLVLLSIGLPVSSTIFILLFRRFKKQESLFSSITGRERVISNLTETSRFPTSLQAERRHQRFFKKKATRSERAKMDSLVAVGVFVVCAIVSMIYHGLFLKGNNNVNTTWAEHRPGMALLFSISLITFITSMNVLWMAWYQTLPTDTRFGAIIGYEPFYIKHHRKLKILNYCMMGSLPLATFFNLLILPEILDESVYMSSAPITSFSICNMIFTSTLVVYIEILLRNVIRMFDVALDSFEKQKSGWITPNAEKIDLIQRQQDALEKAVETAKMLKQFGRVTLVGVNVSYGLWLTTGGYYQYIFANAIAVTPFVAIIQFPLWIYFRTDGGLFPLIVLPDSLT